MVSLRIKPYKFATALELSPSRTVNYIIDKYTVLWKDCTKEFILAVIRSTLVDTTMTRASLLPLAAFIKFKTVAQAEATQGRKSGIRQGLTLISGEYISEGFRSANQGMQLGERAYEIDYGTISNPRWEFEFRIVVFQHLFWEPKQHSLEAGKAAFIAHLETWREYYSEDEFLMTLLTGRINRHVVVG